MDQDWDGPEEFLVTVEQALHACNFASMGDIQTETDECLTTLTVHFANGQSFALRVDAV